MNGPIPQAVTDEITALCRRLRLRYIREQSPDVLGQPSRRTAKPPGSQPGKHSTPGRPNGPRFRSQPRTPSKASNGLTVTRTS